MLRKQLRRIDVQDEVFTPNAASSLLASPEPPLSPNYRSAKASRLLRQFVSQCSQVVSRILRRNGTPWAASFCDVIVSAAELCNVSVTLIDLHSGDGSQVELQLVCRPADPVSEPVDLVAAAVDAFATGIRYYNGVFSCDFGSPVGVVSWQWDIRNNLANVRHGHCSSVYRPPTHESRDNLSSLGSQVRTVLDEQYLVLFGALAATRHDQVQASAVSPVSSDQSAHHPLSADFVRSVQEVDPQVEQVLSIGHNEAPVADLLVCRHASVLQYYRLGHPLRPPVAVLSSVDQRVYAFLDRTFSAAGRTTWPDRV